MIHLQNISLIPIFYSTQVLPTVQKFSKILDKIFFNNMLFNSLFYFPKSIPKNFQKFSFEPFTPSFTATFSMFETCSCQRFLLLKLLASASLVTFVENELSLEP